MAKIKRPWSWGGVTTDQVARLKSLASSAERIESLLQHPGWRDVLEARVFYQGNADNATKNLRVTDAVRFQAVCEWSAIEGFFKELNERVRRGREARKKLEQMLTKT